MSVTLLVASADDHFRETIRENLINVPNSKLAGEYLEVSSSLYIRLLQDIARHPDAGLVLDLAGDPDGALKVLEKVKQAAPDLYVIASNYHADGETVLGALRAGASDFLIQPVKRLEFRDAMSRFERAPKRAHPVASRLGKVYSFLGVKGGAGTTTLAVNFAAVLAQRKQSCVLVDLDWTANDACMQVGATPQNSLLEIGENLGRMDQSLFEGSVAHDPLGFYLVGPSDSLEHRGYFTEAMFRELANFLVERYDAVAIDAGRNIADEVALSALHVSSMVFLVMTQEFAAIRNAQRFLSHLMRCGFTQDQVKIVVNQYQKKTNAHLATPEQIRQTLNQEIFYGIPPSPAAPSAVNRGRPFVADRQAAGDLDRIFRAFVDKATGRKEAAATSA